MDLLCDDKDDLRIEIYCCSNAKEFLMVNNLLFRDDKSSISFIDNFLSAFSATDTNVLPTLSRTEMIISFAEPRIPRNRNKVTKNNKRVLIDSLSE